MRKRLDSKEGAFSLGRFELPVAYAALIWVAFALFALVSPPDAVVPGLVVLGLIVAGGIYFASMLIFNREVLETEPGEPGAFLTQTIGCGCGERSFALWLASWSRRLDCCFTGLVGD